MEIAKIEQSLRLYNVLLFCMESGTLTSFVPSTFGICLGTDTLQTLALELIVGAYTLSYSW